MNNITKLDYGISTCHDMYEKLQFEGERLEPDWHVYDCFNFIITAWHLYYDWLERDWQNRPSLATRKKSRTPENMLQVINAFRDMTNGSKHMTLNQKSEKKKVISEIHEPEIRDLRSFMTGKPKIGIRIEETYYSMWDLRYLITSYFKWIFDNSSPVDIFPVEITSHLNNLKTLTAQH